VNLQEKAERLLKSKEFWYERLQKLDTDFGYYEDLNHLLIVNKRFQSLDLYRLQSGEFELIKTVDIIVGENRGDKMVEGDKKTPTGVYQLLERIDKLDPFYGPLAIVLSYPNLLDSLDGKSGSGIWIHGFPMSGGRELFTKGCVALDNKKLIELNSLIDNLDKATIILEDGRLKKSSKLDLATILSSLYRWLDSWRSSNFESYIEFYGDDFKRFDGNSLDWFKEYKKKIFAREEKKEIYFSNINISPYPNSQNRVLFRVTFDEVYKTARVKFQGKKELYVELINQKMKIVVEK
jgi:murein L,D-transpeptidase YafK